MKGQLSGENKSNHFLLLVSSISTFPPVFLRSFLSADPVNWLWWYALEC